MNDNTELVVKKMETDPKYGQAKMREDFPELSSRDIKRLYDRAKWRIKNDSDGDVRYKRKSLEKEGNVLHATCNSKTPLNPEQALKEFDINPKEWQIKNFRVGQWGNPEKPFYQVRFDLMPLKPELCQWPSIDAVRPQYKTPIERKKVSKKRLKRALIVPDAQIGYEKDHDSNTFKPFHDFKAMDIITQVAKDMKPDKIILMGDMLDLPNYGRYQVKPEHYFTTNQSLLTLRLFIDDLRQHTSEVIYIYGNHEARFRNHLIDHCVENTQLKKVDFGKDVPKTYSLEYLLGLDEIGVRYFNDYPHDEYFLNDHLAFSHSHVARAGSGKTVGSIIQDDPHTSRVIGHIHRCEQATKTTYKRGKPVTNSAYSMGTICRIDKIVPQHATRQNWQQGFGSVYYEEGDGLFNVSTHHIEQGVSIFDGKKYESKISEKELKSRLGFTIKN